MTSKTPGPGTFPRDTEETRISRLLRDAGPREAPPEAARERVFEAVQAHWRTELQTRRRERQRRWNFAAAAAVTVVAVTMLLAPWRGGSRDTALAVALHTATADRIVGTVALRDPENPRWRGLASGDFSVLPGTGIRTSRGSGLGMLLGEGHSLRLGPDTEVRFDGALRLTLLTGTVYVDSGREMPANGNRTDGLLIATPIGTAREIGTQFETHVDDGEMRIRVREGAVKAEAEEQMWTAQAQDEIRIGADGRVERDTVEPWAPAWRWVEDLAPAPYAEEMTLSALLDWVGRETGRRIHFARPDLESRMHVTVLHGSPHRFSPMEALSVMLRTTDFEYTVAGDREILIDTRRTDGSRTDP